MTHSAPNTEDLLCFSLYSASHAISRIYRPLLEPLGLTYPQYLVLVRLWNRNGQNLRELGEALGLESNTLTPLLKRMEKAGLIARRRSDTDERVVTISLSERGRALAPEMGRITACVVEATGMELDDIKTLRDTVTALRNRMTCTAPG